MIPAPALMEYLVGLDAEEAIRQLSSLQRYFLITAFDVPAAVLAADLERGKTRSLVRANKDLDKNKVRIDAQIVAVAIVNGAEKIISHDPHFRELAAGRIDVEEIPEIYHQTEMFDELEDQE